MLSNRETKFGDSPNTVQERNEYLFTNIIAVLLLLYCAELGRVTKTVDEISGIFQLKCIQKN